MANPNLGPFSLEELLYILNHVFLPPKLPQEDDTKTGCDIALCYLVHQASREFAGFLSQHQQQRWSVVRKMLKTLLETTQALDKDELAQSILSLEDGEVLVLHIHSQNAALILRRLGGSMIFEAFEVSATPGAVMEVERKLVCSYPGPAVELPLDVANDPSFVEQLVSFLVHMDVDQLGAPTTTKAQSKVPETRGTAHPRYITQLLIMILHGMGTEAEVKRITKRVADDVCWQSARNPWRRSPLWLVLRVAIQTTADSRDTYKKFMVFFQTKLLHMFLDNGLSSELLYTARVKTSRRVYKLGASASPSLLKAVETVGRKIDRCLQARWSEEQHLQAFSPSYTPDPFTFKEYTTISLLESRDYLIKVMKPDLYPKTSTELHPRHIVRLDGDFHILCPDGLEKVAQADSYAAQLALADFEFLVQERLDSWVTKNSGDESACKTLGSCLKQYITIAVKQYSSAPEAQSLMLLTIMELWVALDFIAVVQCPLLSSYSPEIPASILDPLLLRRAKSIERAARIEQYLRRRHSEATCATSIYSDQLDNTTFAVRYFQRSPPLQVVKASIERDATAARVQKRKELGRMNAEHESLSQRVASCSCEYTKKGRHSYSCSRCKLQKKANGMRITVHEWPLPTRPLEDEAIVFELNCPPVFAIWRTRTYEILRDVGMAHITSGFNHAAPFLLEHYEGLAAWSEEGRSGRVTFGSMTKSFLKSHYRQVRIPADEDSVCVNNGLSFRLYDQERGENAFSSFNLNLDSYCTLPLPEGVYRHLQYAVGHTTHTHNETIVNQGDCPVNLSMHEQLAFSNLRCGPRLQWMNIARELRANILTFSREEVHTLITQAAWQIGPLSNDGLTREWHFELGVSDFGQVLIREAMDLLLSVEANWMEGTTVKSIREWIQAIAEFRDVTHKWMREIAQKLQDAVNDDEIPELQRRACEIAATCRATFDVDPGTHLDALLFSSDDVAILVECAIIIHDNTPPHLGHEFSDFQKLLHRDRRLSHFLELAVSKLIRANRDGLDTAIGSVWSGYRPGGNGWTSLLWANSQWLVSLTASAQEVHYNLLDGELLVGGKPLGRLPREISGHPTYGRIFDKKVLDVIPADMPGMDYMTRSPVCDYQVFFALRDSRLIIRAQTLASPDQVFELIPQDIILGDFPTLLATEHAHWMDTSSGEIEFRPLDKLWKPSPQNWRLFFLPNGRPKMRQGTRYLVDIRSETFEGIAARIRNLESPEYLTIVYDRHHRRISIDLPRFRLSFFLSEGELESKNMHGMVIDGNQSTGTMIGLRNQLVLRHKNPIFAKLPRSRHVLIPYGSVHVSLPPDRNHVHVSINTDTMHQVTWHKYEIDSDLGLLVGNVNLTTRLYRIYLHALCSHPLPDPLTGQTGTDHALQELSAAGCFSFQRLTETDVELLRLIGRITPRRHYYPKHLRVMQTTEWSADLPALSQHGAFEPAVRSILKYAQSLAIFPELNDKNVDLDYDHGGDFFLMVRAVRRNAVYYEGGLDEPLGCGQGYDGSRDSPHVADYDSNGIQARDTSRLVFGWSVGLTRYLEPSELLGVFKKWGHMRGVVPGASLEYTKDWLNLDLSTKFLTIYDLCRQIGLGTSKKFKLVFSFSALAYGMPSLRRFIPVLLAFAMMQTSFKYVDPPPHLSYLLADGFEPSRERVRDIIVSDRKRKPSYHDDSDSDDDSSENKIDSAVDYFMQWWCITPLPSPFSQNDSRWFQTGSIMTKLAEYFESCSRNRDLRSFASCITKALQTHNLAPADVHIPRFRFVPQFDVSRSQQHSPITFATLLSTRSHFASLHSTREFGTEAPTNPRQPGKPMDTSQLRNLISQFQRHHNHSDLTRLYSERLARSLGNLHGQQILTLPNSLPPQDLLIAYRDQCQHHLHNVLSAIRSSLEPSTAMDLILANAGLWPRIHPRSMLHPLASASKVPVTRKWVKCSITFAQAFIEYQFSQRLVTYVLRSEPDNFFKELDEASFDWCDEKGNTDWLLIQIQGNFITRALQSEVAREMITPSSGSNAVLQLNMGEGKSSVIVPLVAVALADSHKLVRIVVLEPLAGQMFHLLVERISGLTNRRIFYLPFSRDVKMDAQQVQHIRSLFEECARVQGVLVAQPKHILSFQLKVIDRMLSSGPRLDNVAQELQKVQTLLASTSRDVLDESDELLHVRYQLIYTMDGQHPLDNGPDRWTITQNVFDLVRRRAIQLHNEFPEEVELLNRGENSGNFSHVRLLGSSAARKLVSQIAKDALKGHLETLSFVGLSAQVSLCNAVLHFITEYHVDKKVRDEVEEFYSGSSLWKGLLLLRGLLAHGILVHVLSRQRWRVDYGLDPKRSLLAVPYRAKDVPSLRSDFGHPDVAVCLTCLSYYYGGLTPSQVRECFDLLSKLDNPTLEYEKWVKRGGKEILASFHQLIGVNTKDVQTFTHDVVPIFQHNQAIIDFFLSQVVFPKEAKEFLFKLGTSGWDLAKHKPNFTTGFSGTKDNSDLLPTSIHQSDPANQLRMNAQVLGYLLRAENDRYICTQVKGTRGQPCSVSEFLDLLVREPKEIRVLLDVGAQMLEMTNKQLVEHWLFLRQPEDVAAGVFFDDADTLSVLSRDGVVEPFYSSPFSQRLNECVIYLDDAHTRGTDLKLPLDFRAMVTLGPKVTKDRLVQGCMRMRKLGQGQSVVFCAPPDIDRRIREAERIQDPCSVKVIDILSWVMSNTCIDIEHHIPHWVQQGVDHDNRHTADSEFLTSEGDVEVLRDAWLQPAARSLEEMYNLSTTDSFNTVKDIPAMQERLRKLGVTTVRDVRMEEEQEREVSHEVEQEQQIERPPKVTPAEPHLNKKVRSFVRHGTDFDVFFPLMTPLRSEFNAVAPRNPWLRRPQVLCTQDFMTTTKDGREKSVVTNYLRPVNWIVSHVLQDGRLIFIVMSPYEVNRLLPDIRVSEYVRLHMYTPRTTQAMKPLDNLAFYCIPPLPSGNELPSFEVRFNVRCQLNIWAGQLYLDSYETYLNLCLLLGISSSEETGYSSVESDRFVPRRGRIKEMVDVCLFDKSPMVLLKTLFGLRRKGMSYHQTHMGKILHARLLSKRDFEE